MGTGWAAGRGLGRWKSGRPPGVASGPRNPPGPRARRARLLTPGPRPPLTLIATRGASGQGWPAVTAEIRPLFPPGSQNRRSGRGARGSPFRPGGRKRGRGSGPGRSRVCAGADEPARADRRGRRFCGPRLPSRGSRAPWRGRRWPGAAWPTQPWELSQALCFSRSAQGQGSPACLFGGNGLLEN